MQLHAFAALAVFLAARALADCSGDKPIISGMCYTGYTGFA